MKAAGRALNDLQLSSSQSAFEMPDSNARGCRFPADESYQSVESLPEGCSEGFSLSDLCEGECVEDVKC